MKYVLDSSIAVKCVIPEADTAQAIAIRDEFCHGIHELRGVAALDLSLNQATFGCLGPWFC